MVRGAVQSSYDNAEILLRAVDVLFIGGLLYGSMLLVGSVAPDHTFLLMTTALLYFQISARFWNLYGSWQLLPLREEMRQLAIVWLAVLSALLITGFALHVTSDYSRLALGTWSLSVPACMLGLRAYLRHHVERNARKGIDIRILAFIGANRTAERIARHFHSRLWSGLRVAGVYDDRAVKRLNLQSLSLVGSIDDLVRDAREGKVDFVFITLPICAEHRIDQIVRDLADTTASVFIVPDAYIFERNHANWREVAGHPIISVYDTPFFGISGLLKRLEDVVVSSLILLLISPLLLAIAVAVRVTSPGPTIFRQRRYGLNGQVVEVWKFRSMTVTENGDTVVQATRGDLRVTPLGAFLRRTSLDELPQFFNVLQGQMSIVGPRPHAVAHNEQYRALIHGYMLRHKVKPGITGWAQINGWRGETDSVDKMEKRVEYDMHYIRNWSLGMDLRIIIATAFKGFRGQNAY
ncbi:putative UDP-sugar lipid carrier transferase [Thiomonas arsenitoxydans]|uniref:Capsular polysaccharide biosynthesis protein UDP-glucose lipid carrier transferase n=1 Tax=Thiomonas arsenitoxydans (strain DSM 22701 / CIP 110005 / 3As) TaxID=426114 RepID=D6CP74_THIA3|nr:undecaprenyl-phosphate glucose phosphotransferase [Thiomonas arsenitoxydans]CAZ90352.1 Putative capsular polysaccharide biosynthesis protein; UDP-glucose lipid carrier transferase [Thiomonas arsenitoxydans]CQR28170.1 putative UDP-sugar lipid carrier transferase [Thiomonas arsenitoxydans]CQR28171.1 putative UDP-sugar lipid carrier transferase [Thiomonas arsenitoxydans]CQR28683.1 putative UDP-sugar lipid carrier transferase [Thiomonas arsenitoxydans]CQR31161.1 putative UDP-sugar lipid carrier